MDAITRHHYENIANGKAIENDDGSLSTVKTRTVEMDGVTYVIPTVWDGKFLELEEATKRALDEGVYESFYGREDAEEFDKEIHLDFDPTTTAEEARQKLQEKEMSQGGLLEYATVPPDRPNPETTLTLEDLEKIERVVWAEANTEGVEGRDAVRGVIFNRLRSDRFGNTIDEVLVGSEFEPVSKYGGVNKIPVPEDQLLRGMEEITDYIQLGEDASKGRTFFQNEKKTKSRGTYYKGANPLKIGNHTFYDAYKNQEPVTDLFGSHNINVLSNYFMKDQGFALGGIATARKGITTPEGITMASKKFQRDDKKADTNEDGELSVREKEIADAVQKNEVLEMAHGGMPCGCSSVQDCMCNEEGIMGYDDVSGNPVPVGSNPENVRDDIDAKLSTDEYVLPAHVVKWHGLKHIQMMQSEAEMGLMAMQMDGLIQYADNEDKSNSEGIEDSEVSDEDYSEQEEAEEETETSTEIPSEEMDIEVATIEVDDQLDDTEDIDEIEPVLQPLPGMLKKQKIAFMV